MLKTVTTEPESSKSQKSLRFNLYTLKDSGPNMPQTRNPNIEALIFRIGFCSILVGPQNSNTEQGRLPSWRGILNKAQL